MDKKLTDSEIMEALKHCANGEHCRFCGFRGITGNVSDCSKNFLNLINRLQAENERLKTENKLLIDNDVRNKYPNCVLVEKGRIYTRTLEDYDKLIGDIYAEAYKECVEKVKEEINEALKNNYKVRSERAQSIPIYTKDEFWNYCAGKIDCLRGIDDFLDNLLNELVGEDNDSI